VVLSGPGADAISSALASASTLRLPALPGKCGTPALKPTRARRLNQAFSPSPLRVSSGGAFESRGSAPRKDDRSTVEAEGASPRTSEAGASLWTGDVDTTLVFGMELNIESSPSSAHASRLSAHSLHAHSRPASEAPSGTRGTSAGSHELGETSGRSVGDAAAIAEASRVPRTCLLMRSIVTRPSVRSAAARGRPALPPPPPPRAPSPCGFSRQQLSTGETVMLPVSLVL